MKPRSIKKLHGWRIEGISDATLADCSLIIATYQRPDDVSNLVEKIDALPSRPFEVIVVDGSADSETEQKLLDWTARFDPSFNLIYARSPAGLTRQRNIGIDLSSGKYLFFLDDDCVPQRNYFPEIRSVFEKDLAGQVGAVSGLIINEMHAPLSFRWRLRLALRMVPRLEPGIYHSSGTALPPNLISPFSGLRRIDTLSGCAMSFRRIVFDQHRFSEFFSGYSQGEDLEISLRIRKQWDILWCGDAHAIHLHAPGGRPPSFSKGVMEIRNKHFIWKRHRPHAAQRDRFRFWLDVAFLIALDLLSFCRHPSQTYHLSHARGLVRGALRSLFVRTTYEEPDSRTEYALRVTG
jgi:GT2 family glycosyltransferase